MLNKTYPYYLANKAVFANTDLNVTNKYTQEVATQVALADASVIDSAIAAAEKAQPAMNKMPAYQRQQILEHCVMRFKERLKNLPTRFVSKLANPLKTLAVKSQD